MLFKVRLSKLYSRTMKTRLNVEFLQEVYKDLVYYAGREGQSISGVVRSLVAEWIVKKRREELEMRLVKEEREDSRQQEVVL